MKKIFYLSTAFILCGMAQSQASCIQTPSCTSLGYTKTSSCTNGLKCPFGSYWYCPSNSGSSGGSGSDSGSGTSSLCSSCNVGDFICGGKCYAPSIVVSDRGEIASDCTYFVTKKENGKCTRVTVGVAQAQKMSVRTYLQKINFDWNKDYSSGAYFSTSGFSDVCRAVSNSSSVSASYNLSLGVAMVAIVPGYINRDEPRYFYTIKFSHSCPYDLYNDSSVMGINFSCNVQNLATCLSQWDGLDDDILVVPVESTF